MKVLVRIKGGPGSGNWAHIGRAGVIGGSASRDSGMSISRGSDWLQRYEAKAGHSHPYQDVIDKDITVNGIRASNSIRYARKQYISELGRSLDVRQEIDNLQKKVSGVDDELSKTSSAIITRWDEYESLGRKIDIVNQQHDDLLAAHRRSASLEERVELSNEMEKLRGKIEKLYNRRSKILKQQDAADKERDALQNQQADLYRQIREKEIEWNTLAKTEAAAQREYEAHANENMDAAMTYFRREAAAKRARIAEYEVGQAKRDAEHDAEYARLDAIYQAVLNKPGIDWDDDSVQVALDNLLSLKRHPGANEYARKQLQVPIPMKADSVRIVGDIPEYTPGFTREATWRAGIDWFSNLTSSNPLFERIPAEVGMMEKDGVRAFCAGRNPKLSANSHASTVVHELGHSLEFADPVIHNQAVRFLNRRTRNETPRRLKDMHPSGGYDDGEMTTADKFMSPYCGKRYNNDGYTEIISMGLQYFFEDPVGFAKKDPDYFDFIYALMRVGG